MPAAETVEKQLNAENIIAAPAPGGDASGNVLVFSVGTEERKGKGDPKRTGASENLKWKSRKWGTGSGGGARSERQREKGSWGQGSGTHRLCTWGEAPAVLGPCWGADLASGGGGVLVRPRPG